MFHCFKEMPHNEQESDEQESDISRGLKRHNEMCLRQDRMKRPNVSERFIEFPKSSVFDLSELPIELLAVIIINSLESTISCWNSENNIDTIYERDYTEDKSDDGFVYFTRIHKHQLYADGDVKDVDCIHHNLAKNNDGNQFQKFSAASKLIKRIIELTTISKSMQKKLQSTLPSFPFFVLIMTHFIPLDGTNLYYTPLDISHCSDLDCIPNENANGKSTSKSSKNAQKIDTLSKLKEESRFPLSDPKEREKLLEATLKYNSCVGNQTTKNPISYSFNIVDNIDKHNFKTMYNSGRVKVKKIKLGVKEDEEDTRRRGICNSAKTVEDLCTFGASNNERLKAFLIEDSKNQSTKLITNAKSHEFGWLGTHQKGHTHTSIKCCNNWLFELLKKSSHTSVIDLFKTMACETINFGRSIFYTKCDNGNMNDCFIRLPKELLKNTSKGSEVKNYANIGMISITRMSHCTTPKILKMEALLGSDLYKGKSIESRIKKHRQDYRHVGEEFKTIFDDLKDNVLPIKVSPKIVPPRIPSFLSKTDSDGEDHRVRDLISNYVNSKVQPELLQPMAAPSFLTISKKPQPPPKPKIIPKEKPKPKPIELSDESSSDSSDSDSESG
jgi:hypothetical protein